MAPPVSTYSKTMPGEGERHYRLRHHPIRENQIKGYPRSNPSEVRQGMQDRLLKDIDGHESEDMTTNTSLFNVEEKYEDGDLRNQDIKPRVPRTWLCGQIHFHQ